MAYKYNQICNFWSPLTSQEYISDYIILKILVLIAYYKSNEQMKFHYVQSLYAELW